MSIDLPFAEPERDVGMQGCYAGFVTRLSAFAIDVVVALTLFALAAHVGEYVVSALIGTQVQLSELPILAAVLLASWWIFYCAYPLTQSGRTVGMAVVGLRVVRVDGGYLNARHEVARVFLFPLSFVFFGVGFLLILLRRDRRALHDLIASSAVVYAWDARAARLRFLAEHASDVS